MDPPFILKRKGIVTKQSESPFIVTGTRYSVVSRVGGVCLRRRFSFYGHWRKIERCCPCFEIFQVVVIRIASIIKKAIVPPDVIILKFEIRQTQLGGIRMKFRQIIWHNGRNAAQGKGIGFAERQDHIRLVPEKPQFAVSFRTVEPKILHEGIGAQGRPSKVCLETKQILAWCVFGVVKTIHLLDER